MRVLIAPNAFRSCLSAADAAAAMARAVDDLRDDGMDVTCVEKPLADGGDGTLAVLAANGWGQCREAKVHNALGDLVPAQWLWRERNQTALIEMSEAAGMRRLTGEPNPEQANTTGVGELMIAALNAGARSIILTMGGSATLDGGAGALAALGARLLDRAGTELFPCPATLPRVTSIDLEKLDPRLSDISLTAWADVGTSLRDCVSQFGPQKGASPAQVRAFSTGLVHWCQVLGLGERLDEAMLGAAGGLAAPFASWTGFSIEPGAEAIASAVGLDSALAQATHVITGEGRFDVTSKAGKAPWLVIQRARHLGLPCALFAGTVTSNDTVENPGCEVISLAEPGDDLERAMAEAPQRLRYAVRRWLGAKR